MKFGKVEDPSAYDLTLPKDHPQSRVFETALEPMIYFGTTMWNVPAWNGKIYPQKCKSTDFLEAYGKQFGTIELNATHYRTPDESRVREWCGRVPPDFRFCPKWPQSITHFYKFRNCQSQTDEFLAALWAFESRMGLSFMQLHPSFSPDHAGILIDYLDSLPHDLSLGIEFRHPDWFQAGEQATLVWNYLADRQISALISDTAGRRDAVHMRVSSTQMAIRFGGYDLHPSDYRRMDEWGIRLSQWIEKGVREIYIFMHQTDSLLSPEACVYFEQKLFEETGIHSKIPRFQQSLF